MEKISFFDKGLAEIIGLEEAVLASAIEPYHNIPVQLKAIKERVPFFTSQKIVRVLKNLQECDFLSFHKDNLSRYVIKFNREL